MMEVAASSADHGLRQKKTLITLAPQGEFALRFACRSGQKDGMDPAPFSKTASVKGQDGKLDHP